MTYRIPVRVEFSNHSHVIITIFQTEDDLTKAINDANSAASKIPGVADGSTIAEIDAKTIPGWPDLWVAGNAFGYYTDNGDLSKPYPSMTRASEAYEAYTLEPR